MASKNEKSENRGRKLDQKMKPFLVYQMLMRETDEEHVLKGEDIATDLFEIYGISAERRSIYRDIEAINQAICAFEEGITLEEATKLIEEDETLRAIRYSTQKRGFYAQRRKYELDDMRFLAECVYASKFISESKAKLLLDVLCDFVSKYQEKAIRHDALTIDRTRTTNKTSLNNIAVINEAMSTNLNGQKHVPKKITFQYLSYVIEDLKKQVVRKHGDKYKVSPFALLISDGNYYLLAQNEKGAMKTYRVDRMKNVEKTDEPREGDAQFDSIDLKNYTRQTFSMFGGKEENVTLQFINPLLDTMVERLGTNAIYARVDDRHMRVTAKVSLSEPFYGWLASFGKKIKLIAPDAAIEKYREHIDKIRQMY